MTKRIVIKIGNIYCAHIDNRYKIYFQYICDDISQLNSSVIRVFKTRYPIEETENLEKVIKDSVQFYAHVILRQGIVAGVWNKVGKSVELGLDALKKIWFATTHDTIYIQKTREIVDVDPDKNWTVWKVNEDRRHVGVIPGYCYPFLELGSVFPYTRIQQRIRLGYMTGNDLIYKYQKRIPLPDVDSYTMVEVDGVKIWRHYLGEHVVQEVVEKNGDKIRLSKEEPEAGGWHLDECEFWQTNWKYYNFITKEEFDKVWYTE